jgi:hypothetical protein
LARLRADGESAMTSALAPNSARYHQLASSRLHAATHAPGLEIM